MFISRIEVRNYRCLKDVAIDCDPLTILVGANGTGKSSLLRALGFFFGETQVDGYDCWGEKPDLTIDVSVTVAELPDQWRSRLRPWLDGNGRLRLTKKSESAETGRQETFVSMRRQVSEFQEARRSSTATELREIYPILKTQSRFQGLPAYQNESQARAALDQWELDQQEDLVPSEDRNLVLGGARTGQIDLSPLFDFLPLPAVREASADAVEGRTGFGTLVAKLVRPTLTSAIGERLESLEREAEESYRRIVDEEGRIALQQFQEALNTRLEKLAPGSSARLRWEYAPPSAGLPRVVADLTEANFTAKMGRQGHGVQRAYIFAILQVAAAERVGEGEGQLSVVIVAIEEPELYQHPVRARYLANLLAEIASGAAGFPAQMIYATHSPFFAAFDRVESIRLFRIDASEEDPPTTTISRVDLDTAARDLWLASGRPGPEFTAATLRSRIRPMIDTPVSEGFFATAAVLVEGEEDRAMILGSAQSMGVDLTEKGIALLPVMGKGSLDKALLIFRQLQIPTFTIFDSDTTQRSDPASNRRLTFLLTGSEIEFPSTQVNETWASFTEDMPTTVRSEIGEAFDPAFVAVRGELGFDNERGKKNAVVLEETFRRLAHDDRRSETLDSIVRKIRMLTS